MKIIVSSRILNKKLECFMKFLTLSQLITASFIYQRRHFIRKISQLNYCAFFHIYLLAEDGADGPFHLSRVFNVHRPHMGLTNVHLSIRMLRSQLWTKESWLGKTNTPFKSHILSKSLSPHLTSLSVGLPLKKSVFLLLFGGLNLGLRKAQPLAMASRGAGPS